MSSYNTNNRHVPANPEVVKRWLMEHDDVASWLASSNSDFAGSLRSQLNQRGYLTDNQVLAVRNSIARVKERMESAPDVDSSAIEKAFAAARASGIVNPKMNLGDIRVSAAPLNGRNAGSLYVKAGDGTYLGKITAGKFLSVQDCTQDQIHQIQSLIQNPEQAAKAYGQRTGVCCICNRLLTNSISIDMGIGPICASRFGW